MPKTRPKQIGTVAETAVVRACIAHGFDGTERIALKGFYDQGDIKLGGVVHKTIIEVKSGVAAETASDGQIDDWLVETERERINANAAVGVLVTKRKGIGPANADMWWAHTYLPETKVYVRMFLKDWLRLQQRITVSV